MGWCCVVACCRVQFLGDAVAKQAIGPCSAGLSVVQCAGGGGGGGIF